MLNYHGLFKVTPADDEMDLYDLKATVSRAIKIRSTSSDIESFVILPETIGDGIKQPDLVNHYDLAVMNRPPAEWRLHAERLKEMRGDLLDVTQRSLAGLIAHLARAHGYYNARKNGRDHDEAVKEANRVTRQVCQTVGYTHPEVDLDF